MIEAKEIVRDGCAASNGGQQDPDPVLWHPDAVYVAAREDPDAATH